MRLLWDESGLELVGAFCVAGFALGGAWVVLESVFGLSTVVAGLLAAAAAGWALETISRRHYADRLAEPRRARGAAAVAGAHRSSEERRRRATTSSDERTDSARRADSGGRPGSARRADSARRAA